MKFEFGNDPAKIEGYKKFWRLDPVKRPLVGFSFKSWFPLDEFKASAAWEKGKPLTPDMVRPEDFLDDQEKLLVEGETMDDDILRGVSAAQSVFWAEGILGCKMRVLPGNVVAEPMDLSWEEADKRGVDRDSPWYKGYIEFTDVLVKRSNGRYPVSHGMLTGPLDYAVSLRGHEQMVVDLMLEPERASALLERMGTFFIDITNEIWKRIPLFHGGYYDAQYNLWAPEPICRLQEDASAVLSPDLYSKYVKPVDARITSHYGSAFIHLHATSMIVLDLMLEIPTLRCYEVNNDVGGPPVAWLVPYLQKIQAAKKPLLIRGSFTPEEMRLLVDSLEPAGLYLYVMINDMKEAESLRPIVGL
jgi:hypothetical protein